MKSLIPQQASKIRSGVEIGLLIFAILAALFELGLFATWQEKLTDTLYSQKSAPNDIVIIAIDDKSIQKIGRWPWGRKKHAELLDKLGEAPPKVVGLDISFFEESGGDDVLLANSIKNLKNSKVVLAAEFNDGVLLKPIEELMAVTEAGIVNTFPDTDGVVRKADRKSTRLNSSHMSI